MPIVPDHSISHVHTEFFKDRKELDIKWNDLTIINVISNLPADTALWMQNTNTFAYHASLLFQVCIKLQFPFILLAQVIRRRGHDQLDKMIRNLRQEIQAVAFIENEVGVAGKFRGDRHRAHTPIVHQNSDSHKRQRA